jgi:16S rRNA A1518/A1519 N6-dimethyltransferase RsmA/KsgA/DIM1 with predicted DNA glycosylase/AP lyase activity
LLDPIRWDEPEHIRLFSYGMVEDGLLKAGFKKVNGYGVTVINNKPYKLTNKFMIKYLSQHLIFVAEVR